MTPIQVYMPAGEAREGKMQAAIEADKQGRFVWAGNASDLPGDVQFRLGEKIFNLELKDFTGKNGDKNSDVLSSIVDPQGHLYLQTNKLRNAGHPCAICVLGNEADLDISIQKSVLTRGFRGGKSEDMMINYRNMVYDFEAECHGLNIGFWWYKDRPWRRILSGAHKILTGGNLSQYAPTPPGKEAQAVALSILAGDGIGPKMAANILLRYNLCLILRDGYCGDLEDVQGIGPKRAETIKRNIEVMD